MRWLRRLGGGLVAAALVLGALWAWLLRSDMPPPPELPGKFEREYHSWATVARPYSTYRPLRVREPTPLVIVLHGSAGDGDQAREMTGRAFDVLAEEHGFVVAYPDGWKRHWNGCRAKGPYEANRLNADDVGYLKSVIGRIALEEGTSFGHVYVTGVSNGGHMALRLALEAPQIVRAVAPVVAAMPAGDNMGCTESGEAVPVLIMNGTEDPMNPWEGGEVALYGLFANRGEVHSTPDSIRYWAGLAGYTGEPAVERLPDRDADDGSYVEVHRWAEPGRPEVVLYAVVGGGHTLPNLEWSWPRLIGPTNHDIDGPREIWRFFARVGGYGPLGDGD